MCIRDRSTEPTVDTVIFDTELTPRQNRNIEQFLDGKVQVCDRTTRRDLRLHVNEDLGCCGVVWGCVSGFSSFFFLCRGVRVIYLGHTSSDETKSAKRGCCGIV